MQATVVRAQHPTSAHAGRHRAGAAPTAPSTASSAATARRRRCASTACMTCRPASRCCCGSCPASVPREPRGGRGHGRQPVPVSGGAVEIFLEPRVPGTPGAGGRRQPDRAGAGDARAGRWASTWSWCRRGGREPAAGRRGARRRLARPRGGAGADRGAAARRALRRAGGQPDPGRRGARRRSTSTDEQRSRVHSPAGLDIGGRTAAEIALSVLAELVAGAAGRRNGRRARRRGRRATAHRPGLRHDGRGRGQLAARRRSTASTTWFCCAGCRTAFLADPARYAAAS